MKQRVASAFELEQLLDAGSISIGIAIPEDFDRRVLERETGRRPNCWWMERTR